jgi:hypothetical protein
MTLTPSTRNITKLFRTATLDEIKAGLDWYTEALATAQLLAVKYNVPVSVAAGVIAAVSPLNSWGSNKVLADKILAAGGLTEGYLTVGLNKATAIIKGGDPPIVLGGEKTTAFYLSIISGGLSDAVCIDRHSWSLSVNIRYAEGAIPSLKGRRYRLAADAHRRAARILSKEYGMPISPAQCQAVCWGLWRRLWWSEGAFDGLS